MVGPQAPAGWYPDPADDAVVRYWDGSVWTDLAAAPAQPLRSEQSTNGDPPLEQPEPVVHETTTPAWATIGIVVLTAALLVGLAVYLASRVSEPDHPYGAQPSDERAVVNLIEAGRRQYDAADHDLQRDAALADRDEQICALLGDGRVEQWTGQIYEIDASRDGKGIIGINIEPNTQVTTRDGAFATDDTLIPAGPLLDRVTEMETGEVVTFSGRFIPDDGGSCFTNPRITQKQSIEKPLMVFRFRDVRRP
jgi:hypothetical protein